MKIVGIAGALRQSSTNRGMLRVAQRSAPPGVELMIVAIDGLPFYNMDEDPSGGGPSGAFSRNRLGVTDWPAAVASLRSAVEAADGLLFAVGTNNRTFPAPLGNALAWLSRPCIEDRTTRILRGKCCALMGCGGAKAGVDGRTDFERVLRALGAEPIDAHVDASFDSGDFEPSTGEVCSDLLQRDITALVGRLVAAVRRRSST